MGRALSMDLRERILSMILSGSSCRAAARHFGVGESTAIRLKRRYLAEGTIEPKQQGGQLGRSKLTPFRDYILDIVKARPDITLLQFKVMIFEEKGIKASVFCVWAFLKREKMSYKKLYMRLNVTEIMWLRLVLFGTTSASLPWDLNRIGYILLTRHL